MAGLCLSSLPLSRVRPAELDALWWLYENLDGAHWTHNHNWDRSRDPCRRHSTRVPRRLHEAAPEPFGEEVYNASAWFGVGCSDSCDDYLDGPKCTAGRIVSLRLRDNGLAGNISGWQQVGELANLSHLDLSYNSIDGQLPEAFGEICNLELFNLRNNRLLGSIPSSLGRCGNASDDGGVCPLHELSLASNAISGTLPSQLANLTELEYLDVSGNLLGGTVPAGLLNLSALQALHLHENELSGSLPEFGVMRELRYLRLEHNSLSGSLPTELGNLTSLQTLDAFHNHFVGEVPVELGALTKLYRLRLHENNISGSLPSSMGRLRQLETLDVHANPLTGETPPWLVNLANLEHLYVPNEILGTLRLRYCRQRIPNNGKVSWRIVREEYLPMAEAFCLDPYDTDTAFLPLDDSGAADQITTGP